MIFILLGLLAGALSGLVGIGGGSVIIPGLLLLGFNQLTAQGTSLAMMIPPIGILAAYSYYQHGHIDFKVTLLLIAGFILGAFFGAKLATILPLNIVRKCFAVSIIIVGIGLFLEK